MSSPKPDSVGAPKPPVSFHFFHRWTCCWELVIRKDLQGGEFWMKECLICGKIKTKPVI